MCVWIPKKNKAGGDIASKLGSGIFLDAAKSGEIFAPGENA